MLFDTNGVLDVMLDRAPFADIAAQVFSKGEAGEIGGFLGTTTITTIHYLAAKVVGADQAQIEIGKLFRLFEFAPVNRAVLEDAAVLNFSDFEGAVLHEAARHVGVHAIVTRNLKDFKRAVLPVYSPEELARILATIK
ncbi:MAG: twitching motility protein PilT, partial [Candidatus Latescibacteria bacterium 4484_107]